MLSIAQIQRPEDRSIFLEEYNPQLVTWVVSDLRSKFEVQALVMEELGSFEDECCLRASELWLRLLRRAAPDFRIVSRDFVRSVLHEELQQLEGVASHQADDTVLEMMELLSPVFCHPEGFRQLKSWLREQPKALQRWGGWASTAQLMMEKFLHKKILAPSWVAGFLQNETQWEKFWNRPLVVDLGGELTQKEAELFQTLSRSTDVLILEPTPVWAPSFSYLLKPYQWLHSHTANVKSSFSTSIESKPQRELRKMTGPLAEVKHATAQARAWIEQGIEPHKIAIIAPDIEKYWILLEPYLREEGLPLSKDATVRLQSFPHFSHWLSRLRVAAAQVSYGDLEASVYAGKEVPRLRYEQFQALFTHMLDVSDLSREAQIAKAFASQRAPEGLVSREIFIGWILKFWSHSEGVSTLEGVLRELFLHGDEFLKMSLPSWLYFLEQIVAKKEVMLIAGHRQGIQVTSLSAADSFHCTHRIFLGLTEGNFNGYRMRLVTPGEMEGLYRDLGFQLEHSEEHPLHFELHWLLQRQNTVDHLCFPMSSEKGAVEAPHPLWMSLTEGQEVPLTVPEMTRWDSLHRQKEPLALAKERGWSSERFADLWKTLERDLGEREFENIHNLTVPSLSASALESFQKCPFIFAASRIFQLQDLPEVDLDLDRRTRGQLAHLLFRELTVEPRRFEWREAELRDVLEKLKVELPEAPREDLMWRSYREKHVRLGLRFLQFEKQWKQEFPETQVLMREKHFKCYYHPQTREFSKEETSGAIKWSGQIDRVDRNSKKQLVLLDYKSRMSSEFGFSQWIKAHQLQLGFYAMAIDEGLVEGLDDNEVIGAFYYIYKNFVRHQGLRLDEEAGTLFPPMKGRSKIDRQVKGEFYQQLKVVIGEFVQALTAGELPPIPEDVKTCITCRWRGVCRAPHLH